MSARRERRRASHAVTALSVSVLSMVCGCTVGPDFRSPEVAAPAQWAREPAGGFTYGGEVDAEWWRSFHDTELDSLVSRLARQNLGLQQAAQRVEEARQQMRVAAAAGLPQAGWSGGYAHRQLSSQGIFSLAQPRQGASFQFDFFSNTLSAGWDLDLFGMVRRAVEAQRASTDAARQARRALALATVADLATSYMQLRGVQEQARILQANVDLAQKNLDLVTRRFTDGVATTLDLAQARGQLATMRSQLPDLRDREAALINAIGYLLAEPPRALEAELARPAAQPAVPPEVPVGLPGSLARRRPDILAAEARLHAATAQVGVAAAAFYPDITLTGAVGTETLSAADFFSLPARQFATGPTLSVPLFQGGRLTGTLHLRKAQQKEAALAYRDAVLGAWREVDDAMTAYAQAHRARADTREASAQERTALSAARQRYTAGATDYLNVVSGQARLLETESALAANETKIEVTLVSLYRALGGGWALGQKSGGELE